MNKQAKERQTHRNGERERQQKKTDRMCSWSHCVYKSNKTRRQDSQSADLTSRHNTLVWVEWDSFSGFLHALNHWIKMLCSMQNTEFHIDIVCIVLVVAAAAAAALSLLVLFYDIFFAPSSNESRSDGRSWSVAMAVPVPVCVYDYLCAQFLVRFINDVTFNICETWAQNQFRSGLFLAVCLFPCTNIYCSL